MTTFALKGGHVINRVTDVAVAGGLVDALGDDPFPHLEGTLHSGRIPVTQG